MLTPTRCVNIDCPSYHAVRTDGPGHCHECGQILAAMELGNTDYPETRHPDVPSEHWWATPDPEVASPPSTPWKQEVGATFAGRYKVLGKLGQGGMGAVYKVHDDNLDRVVALKIPSTSGATPVFIKRFIREARAMARLSRQDNICKIIDVVSPPDGVAYLTMEFIQGRTLSDKIKKEGQLPISEAVRIVRVLSVALDAVHKLGMIHRDLKPANIMIRDDGEPIVMDFGLARRDGDERITQTNATMGTLPYMSPEQIRGQNDTLSAASDIYSMGVILYEALTGRKPFTGNESVMVGRILVDDPQPPSEIRPDLPPEIEAICLKALAKEPKHRHASMGAIAAALAAIPRPADVPTQTYVHAPGLELTPIVPEKSTLVDKPVVDQPVVVNQPVVIPGPPKSRFNHLAMGVAVAIGALVILGLILRLASQPAASGQSGPVVAGNDGADAPALVPIVPDPGKSPEQPSSDQPARKPPQQFVSPSTGMTLILVSPGKFRMGSDSDRSKIDERPRRDVAIRRPYYLGKFEVTQAAYLTVTGKNPSRFLGDLRKPVERVSWLEAVKFCNALSLKDGLTPFYSSGDDVVTVPDWSATGYRLPTEAEWEFACRAGRTGEYGSTDDESDLQTQAWFHDNSKVQKPDDPSPSFDTHAEHPDPTRPHPLGLHNMQGNVWEWCWDWYEAPKGGGSVLNDPTGPAYGDAKVQKGGTYNSLPTFLRPAARSHEQPTMRSQGTGFRVARSGE